VSLYEKLNQDFKTALKARDEVRVAVLRMLKAAIKNKEVQARRKLEEKEILGVITSQTKQRRDSIAQFEEGGRADLVEREKVELAVLEGYLPSQLDRAGIETAVDELVEEIGVESMKDMGRVMKTFTSRYAGQADNRVVSEVVKQKLAAL